jgi:hypothetical protein
MKALGLVAGMSYARENKSSAAVMASSTEVVGELVVVSALGAVYS